MYLGQEPATAPVDIHASTCDRRMETPFPRFSRGRVAATLTVGFPIILPGPPDRIVGFGRYDLVLPSMDAAATGGNGGVGAALVAQDGGPAVGLTPPQLDTLLTSPDVELRDCHMDADTETLTGVAIASRTGVG